MHHIEVLLAHDRTDGPNLRNQRHAQHVAVEAHPDIAREAMHITARDLTRGGMAYQQRYLVTGAAQRCGQYTDVLWDAAKFIHRIVVDQRDAQSSASLDSLGAVRHPECDRAHRTSVSPPAGGRASLAIVSCAVWAAPSALGLSSDRGSPSRFGGGRRTISPNLSGHAWYALEHVRSQPV